MKRIYFDTNVFSDLRRNAGPIYQQLNSLINQYKIGLSIVFSQGHIRDKRKDYTEFKFLDFEFMEGLVIDNYLCYNPIEKRTSFYLVTPKMVYDDDKNDFDDLTKIFDPKPDDDENSLVFKKSIQTLFSSIKYQ